MIVESAELGAITRRWVKAYADADWGAMANFYSHAPSVRYIGSDPDEVFRGAEVEVALPVHLAEINERIPAAIDIHELEAFEHGETGWSSVRMSVRFGGLDPVEMHTTLVFALEDGVWRIVHSHNGFVRPNPDVVGVTISRGIEALLSDFGDTAEAEIRSRISEGVATLMFTDIEGSTEWLSRIGDEAWARVVGWHDGAVRELVSEHSGTVVKTLGDGAMAAFGSVRSAARAAAAIQLALEANADLPDLRVRIGLHVGDVLRTAEDYLGQVVHKAARIASAAKGGEIMVSAAVAGLLADNTDFDVGDPILTELKGLPGVHSVFPLLWRT